MANIISTKILEVEGSKYSISSYDNGVTIKKRLVEKDKSQETPIEETCEEDLGQEEIMSHILLSQAEILANQNAQDEVLAEMLINSLEV